MAQDIFLGIIKKSWAREDYDVPLPPMPIQDKLILTEDEKERLAKIATLRMKAESGNRTAKQQWKQFSKRATALGKRAKKGDPSAKRLVEVINQSGVLGPAQQISGDTEPRDQNIIDKLIQRAGNATGWPTSISRNRYADYQSRASRGDQKSKEMLTILDRYIKSGKVKVSDEKRIQISSYPIGGSICSDDLEAARYGGSSEREAFARRIKPHSTSGSRLHNRMITQLQLGTRAASPPPSPNPSPGDSPSPNDDSIPSPGASPVPSFPGDDSNNS